MTSLTPLAWDTETALFRPGCMAPPMACVTWQTPVDVPRIDHAKKAERLIGDWLENPEILNVLQNAPYDMAVVGAAFPDLVPAIFRAYEEDRVTDTMVREQLIRTAMGTFKGELKPDGVFREAKYSLDDLSFWYLDRKLDKDTWRLRYGEFIDVPLEEWPEGARTYPLEDARATLDVFLAQEEGLAGAGLSHFVADQFRQCRANFALHLTSAWGLRTRKEGVDALEQETLLELNEIRARLVTAGLVRAKGFTRDIKAASAYMAKVCAELDIPLRRTKPTARNEEGNIALDEDACKATKDPVLQDYADVTKLSTLLAKDVKALRAGTVYPVHTRFGFAETGRTTSSKPNVQNWVRARKGKAGVRECFVPRPGYVFAAADYSSLELFTLAEVCYELLGQSALGDVLNQGLDPHTALASHLLGVSYEKGVELKKLHDPDFDNARQTAKVANFGFPGGLGPASLVQFARATYGVIITEQEAKQLKADWLRRWPEMDRYFKHVSRLNGRVEQLYVGRIRSGASYPAACNSLFQGLGADVAKRALWLVTKACYATPGHILADSRPVNFVHDEIILEVPDDARAGARAHALSDLMVAGAKDLLKHVCPKAEPVLMRHWSKSAVPVFDAEKNLIPWPAPEAKAA